MERHDEAVEAFKQTVEIEPGNSFYHGELAVFLYVSNRDLALAEDHARRALKLNPDDLISMHTLAMILLAKENWTEAEKSMKKFFQISSSELIEDTWESIFDFFKRSVDAGYVEEAVSLVESMGRQDEWRPMMEALVAIREERQPIFTPWRQRSESPRWNSFINLPRNFRNFHDVTCHVDPRTITGPIIIHLNGMFDNQVRRRQGGVLPGIALPWPPWRPA